MAKERKKEEETLKESETIYRTLFDNSEDGFILLEPIYAENGEACDFRFLRVNRAYEHQTGKKVAIVEGKRAREVAPDLERHADDVYSTAKCGGKPEGGEEGKGRGRGSGSNPRDRTQTGGSRSWPRREA